MPSTTDKQSKFMRIAAHDKKFADKAGIDQSVAKEFSEADKEKKKSKMDTLYSKKSS